MRYLTFLLIALLFISCISGSKKSYHFGSVGWTIKVPSELEVKDSLVWSKQYPGAPDGAFSDKILIEVREKGGRVLGGSYLIAAIKEIPEDSQSWADKIRLMRRERVEGYTKDYLPKATIDTVYSTETIDGKVFDKTYFKVRSSTSAENLHIYSRIINGYEYHCVIGYMDTTKGKVYTDIFKASTFEK